MHSLAFRHLPRTLELPRHLEVLFVFLFSHHMFNLLDSSPSVWSHRVHVHPDQHRDVQRPVPYCVSGVGASYPTGYSTPLKTLGISRRLPRRRLCRSGAPIVRAISETGSNDVRSRPSDVSLPTTPASFCNYLPPPPPPSPSPLTSFARQFSKQKQRTRKEKKTSYRLIFTYLS